MSVFSKIKDYFDKRRRNLDLSILWPVCVENAETLDAAKTAFAYHAFNDGAWLSLGETEIFRIISNLGVETRKV